jgi:O-acetyl-ADP-ribose deacetylase (regulator of RNase III)
MIHEVSGDILLSKAQALAHGVAPNDHFDQGLALALREKWPAMAKDFRHFANTHHPKPGTMWAWGGFGVRIFNLLTQEGDHGHGARPGKATVANVNHALRHLQHELEKGEITSISLPRIATGVGGLDWAEVRPLLQSHLGGLKIPVFVYTEYHKDVAAQEPGL